MADRKWNRSASLTTGSGRRQVPSRGDDGVARQDRQQAQQMLPFQCDTTLRGPKPWAGDVHEDCASAPRGAARDIVI